MPMAPHAFSATISCYIYCAKTCTLRTAHAGRPRLLHRALPQGGLPPHPRHCRASARAARAGGAARLVASPHLRRAGHATPLVSAVTAPTPHPTQAPRAATPSFTGASSSRTNAVPTSRGEDGGRIPAPGRTTPNPPLGACQRFSSGIHRAFGEEDTMVSPDHCMDRKRHPPTPQRDRPGCAWHALLHHGMPWQQALPSSPWLTQCPSPAPHHCSTAAHEQHTFHPP